MKKIELSRNPEIFERDIASVEKVLNEEIRERAKLTYQWVCCYWLDEHGEWCMAKNDYPSRIDDMDAMIAQGMRTLIKLQEELKELGGRSQR